MYVAQVGQNLFVTIVARVKTLEIGLVIGLVTTQINIHVGVSPMKSFFCTATILALKSQHVTFMEVMSELGGGQWRKMAKNGEKWRKMAMANSAFSFVKFAIFRQFLILEFHI